MKPQISLWLLALGGLLALTSACSSLTRMDEIHIVKDTGPPEVIQLPGNVTAESLKAGGISPLAVPRPRKGG